ncbi:MAG: hypothetical protein FJX67_17380 [Alphaproteobacteria bacterium]|nr:hypothetical protein [Alphaproteobacteria bacterium]
MTTATASPAPQSALAALAGFLFGRGWWMLWHFWLWSFALPSGLVTWYFAVVFVPGGGPQGGEAIVAAWAWWMLGYSIAAAVAAILWAKMRTGTAWRRRGVPAVAALGLWLLVLWLDLVLIDRVIAVETGVLRLAATVVDIALKLALLWVHLFVVWRYRRRGAGAGAR